MKIFLILKFDSIKTLATISGKTGKMSEFFFEELFSQ